MSSICTGVFALADAGLLDNRRVTTHWLFTDELKTRFPEIRLDADRIYIVDGPIWTAAGNSAGIDLTLHMLESDFGSDLARTGGSHTRGRSSALRRPVAAFGVAGHESQIRSHPVSAGLCSAKFARRFRYRTSHMPQASVRVNSAGHFVPRPARPRQGNREPQARSRTVDDRAKPTPHRSRCPRNRIRRSGTNASRVHTRPRSVPTGTPGNRTCQDKRRNQLTPGQGSFAHSTIEASRSGIGHTKPPDEWSPFGSAHAAETLATNVPATPPAGRSGWSRPPACRRRSASRARCSRHPARALSA